MTAIDEHRMQRLRDDIFKEIEKDRATQTATIELVNRHEMTIANLLVENDKLNRHIAECRQWLQSFRDDGK